MAMFNSYVSWPEGTQYVLPILGLPKYPHDIPLAAMAVLPHKSSALVWANLVPLPRLRPRTGVPRQAQGEFQGIFMGLIVTISCFFWLLIWYWLVVLTFLTILKNMKVNGKDYNAVRVALGLAVRSRSFEKQSLMPCTSHGSRAELLHGQQNRHEP